ncbi:integrase arm-type DNA-binding domain-containing protein [Hyphococcus formosus]|uniref:tyrosine-type recombinase/integrase n=1 Tax=Hyphococcus formosus TaxID=3143534 RepID=UPI00398B3F62
MLSDLKIRNAAPKAKPYKIADGGGLHLLVNPSGSKLWRFKYRVLGKEKLLSFGCYPDLTLAKARKERDAAREQLAAGIDPSEARKAEKEKRLEERERVFERLASEFLEKQKNDGRAESTLKKNRWVLDMACAEFGNVPVTEIKAPTILKALKKVEARGTFETARRLKVMISAVLRYGMSLGWIDADPTPALHGVLARPPQKPRAAITDERELGGLLRAIDGFNTGQPTTRIGLQLLILLYPRPGELRGAKWGEFDFDKAVWTIPAERTKLRRIHRVPLPKAAISYLDELKELTGYGELILPSLRSSKKPISDATFNAVLRRMGFTGEEVTAHGFRATFSTLANESGLWNPDAIERALAHLDKNSVRAAYARGEFWDERVRMAEWWAEHLNSIKQFK